MFYVGLTATNLHTVSEQMPIPLGFRLRANAMNIHARQAATVGICVTAIAIPALPSPATADPALNPNKPSKRS